MRMLLAGRMHSVLRTPVLSVAKFSAWQLWSPASLMDGHKHYL